TVASFGKEWKIVKVPLISDPTIVVECDLMPAESEESFEKANFTAEVLKKELQSILANYNLKIDETRMMRVPINPPQQVPSSSYDRMDDYQINQELRRIKAAEDVLKRKGLDIFERLRTEDDIARYQPILGLWQNEVFLTDLEQAVLEELEHDPRGIRRFLTNFEAHIEGLDARWLLTLWRQDSGHSIRNLDSLLKEYQETYTSDLLLELKTMRETAGIDPITQRRLDLWQQVVTKELIDVDLEPQRTELRQMFTTKLFHFKGRGYTVSGIIEKVLRELEDRDLRFKAWTSLMRFSRQIEPMMREFFAKSNSFWQERGYENANIPRLQAIGVSESIARQIISNYEEISRSTARKTINGFRDLLGHEIAPWDWRFASTQMLSPFEQAFGNMDAIYCVKQTYEKFGIEIDQLPIHFAASSNIYNTVRYYVRIPHDIILSYGALSSYQKPLVLIRDLGRACYFAHIDESLAYPFRRYAPLVLSEGLGTLASWVTWEPGWLEEFTNLAPEKIEISIHQIKSFELLRSRLYAGLALFELDAYSMLAEDPEADLQRLYAQHMEKFIFLPNDDQSFWVPDPRLVEPFPHPIKNILSVAVAANLLDYLQRKGFSLLSPHFGDLFRSDLVQLGNADSWLKRLQQLTTRALTPLPMSWIAT
ncbi:MAG: hypothetical protein ACFFB3_24580, partial [Candidatus Hodarchaeota archaeon]